MNNFKQTFTEKVENGESLDFAKDYLETRLTEILEGNRAYTTSEEDFLLEVVGKYFYNVDSLLTKAVEICFQQIRSYVNRRIREMQIDTQDIEDCYQDVKMVICQKLPTYESERNQISAFIQRQVNMLLYERKNRLNGITTNTRYNATITKLSLEAKAALIENGNPNPSETDIAKYININERSYKDVTAQMVKNALNTMVQKVDLDDTYPSDFQNPETMALKNAAAEELKVMFDGPSNAKEVSTLYKIMYNYYLNEDNDNDKKISADYIKKEMKAVFGREYTSEKIASLKSAIQRKLAENGYGSLLMERPKKSIKSAIDGFLDDEDELDLLENDLILDANDIMLNLMSK